VCRPDNGRPSQKGPETVPAGNMHLYSTTQLTGELLKGRLKIESPEYNPGDIKLAFDAFFLTLAITDSAAVNRGAHWGVS